MYPKSIRTRDKQVLEDVRKQACSVCGGYPVDASHVKSRGSGGPDATWNVVPHCRRHHQEWHLYGARRFFLRYPVMEFRLKSMGWTWDGHKLWHPELISSVE